jgi:hypothetical protein
MFQSWMDLCLSTCGRAGGGETPTLLGSLERTNLTYWAAVISQVHVTCIFMVKVLKIKSEGGAIMYLQNIATLCTATQCNNPESRTNFKSTIVHY